MNVREVDTEHIATGEYVITHVVKPGTFDEPWSKAEALHEVTTAQDYAPRGPSLRQLDRHDVGSMIHAMLTGAGDAAVAIGVNVRAQIQQSEDAVNDIAAKLQDVLRGGFDGEVFIARRLSLGARESQGVDPRNVLNKVIGPDNARSARWAVLNQGTQQVGFRGNGQVRS